MAKTVLGKVGMTPKGSYSNVTEYKRLDVVTHDGCSYVCLKTCTGIAVTNTEYWQLIAEKGHFTEQDREDFKNAVVEDSKDEMDTYTDTKKSELDTYVEDYEGDLKSSLDSYETTKETELNEVTSDNISAINRNAENKTTEFNTNATSKTTEFNDNAIEKNDDFNTNAGNKTTEFDNNATDKTAAFNDNAIVKTNEYNENADEVININKKITNLIDTELDTGTVEGTTIDVDDSAEWEGSLVPGANLEQKQLSGKNLYNDNAQITEYYINGSGKRVTGSNGDTFIETVIENNIASDYVISFKEMKGISYVRFSFFNEDTFISRILLTTGNTYVTVPDNTTKIYIHTDKREAKYFTELQIEQGSIATSYEPYCGGQASPNPNYPQDIKVVTGSNVIKHRGNNLCNIINVSGYTYSNGIPTVAGAIQIEKYDSNNVSFRATHNAFRLVLTNVLKLKPNTEYTLSYIRKDSLVTGAVARKYIYSYDNDTYTRISSNDSVDGENVKSSFTTTDSGLIALAWGYNDSAKDSSSVVSNIQIEEGSTATEFKEYRLEELPLNLSDIELCKIRDYEDTIFKNVEESKYYNSELVNSEFYKYNRIMKGNTSSLANPTVITTALADNLFGCVFSIAGINKVENEKYSVISNILSSKVLGAATDTENKDNVRFYQGIAKHTASNNQIVITVDKSYLSEISAQGLVNFLEDNNFYFYYILDKSTYEQITNPTLIAQLEALLKIQMYHGENHFWVETDNLEPVMDLTYKQSNKIKNEKQNARLDNIESRLALLE